MDAIYGNIGDYQQKPQSQQNTINKNSKSPDFKTLQDELSKKLKQPFIKPKESDFTDLDEEPIYGNINEPVQPQNANFTTKQNIQKVLPKTTETAKYNQTQNKSEIYVTKRNNVIIPLENDDDEAVYGNFDAIADYNKEKLSAVNFTETEITEEEDTIYGNIDTIKTSEYNKTKTTTPDFKTSLAESLKLALQSRQTVLQKSEEQEKSTNSNIIKVTSNLSQNTRNNFEEEQTEYDNIIITPSDENIGGKADFKLNLQRVQNALAKKFVQHANESTDNDNLSYSQTSENVRKVSKTSVNSFKSDGFLSPGSNVKRFTPSPELSNEEDAFYGNLPPSRQLSKTSTSSNEGYLTPRKFTKSPVNDRDTSFDNSRKISNTSVKSNTSSDGYLTPISANVRKFSKPNTPEPTFEEDAIYGNIETVRKISKANTPESSNDEDALYDNLSNLQTTPRKISNNSSDGYLTPIGKYGRKFQEPTTDEDDETDAIYGNLDYLKIHENNRKVRKTSESSDDDALYGNVGNGFPNGNGNGKGQQNDFGSNESLDDDFDSDSSDEDEDLEKTDITNIFSSKLDALPLKELLENQHTENLKWSLIMNKLNINIFQIDERYRNLQDAKFELVAAEFSFLKAVNVLNEQFVGKLCIVLSKNENSKLFAYVKEVKECSKNFLRDLEKTWQMNKFTEDFSKVICDHLEKRFDVYVRYIANQVYSEVLLGEIVSDKSRAFNEILNDLQNEPKCNGLHLHAYQLIPIRKINSFPILLENVLRCLSTNDKEYQQCTRAMALIKQLLVRCNTESNKGKEHLGTKAVLEKLEFPKNVALQINQTGDIHMRQFIKSDKMELIEITNSLFGKKITKKMVSVFLFNDIFVVARQRASSNKYQVLDYCFRINIELDSNPLFLQVTHNLQRNTLLYLHIKENRYLKKTELILDCLTKTDAIRWVEALDPPDTAKSHRTFDFDFIRKVIVQRNCSAGHSDEINLTIGEEFKILRETEDGWSFGQRVKDGECGWFQTDNVILVDDVKRRIHDVKEKYRPNK